MISEYSPVHGWRILQLKRGALLAVSHKNITVFDATLESDVLAAFSRASDGELLKMGRLASVIWGATFSISALPERFVTVLRSNGEIIQTRPQTSFDWGAMQVSLTFRTSAAGVLASRPDGVRIFFDGMNTNSDARKVSEYFRLLEAGFGLKGRGLAEPLISFLSNGSFAIDIATWQRLKRLRDRLSHAYRAGEASFESDAVEDVDLIRMISADVLAHKSNWGSADTNRIQENYFATYRSLDGTIMITRGSSPTMSIRVIDPVTGIPVPSCSVPASGGSGLG